MSVITLMHVTRIQPNEKTLKEELLEKGVVHPQSLYSMRRKQYVELDSVLDYAKCSTEKTENIRKELKEQGYKNYIDGAYRKVDFTDEEIESLLYYPVRFSEDGNSMFWSQNYGHDEPPSFMISSLFEDEIFRFESQTEGTRNGIIYFKGDTNCDLEGNPVNGIIPKISTKLCTYLEEKGQYRVSLPLYPDDKYFTNIYVDKKNVIDCEDGRYYILCINDMEKDVPVYRTLFNGDNQKDMLTYNEIKEKFSASIAAYREQKKSDKEQWITAESPAEENDYEDVLWSDLSCDDMNLD